MLETAGTTECVSLDAPLDPTKDTTLIDLALTTPTPENDHLCDLDSFLGFFSNPVFATRAMSRLNGPAQPGKSHAEIA